MLHWFKFRQQLKEKKPLIGTLMTLESPQVAEILAAAGYDWIFVDLEHSPLDIAAAQRILQAAGSACPCVLRAPCHDEVWIKKILDIGPAGILFPQVNSAQDAERIVRFCKYPPQGCRSVGLARAHGYGLNFKEYVDRANEDVAVIIQIEHIRGVNAIEEIVKVPGIDALFIGPYDLSGSMNKPGQVNDPEVKEQIEKVRRTCLDAGPAVGIFTVSPTEAKQFIDTGYSLIAVGIDTAILAKTVKDALQVIKS
jgi:2-dehydro-3-deoxyglucarate aldolase/4-hydroxy-2-oxoheptanedioate aldolase